MINPNLIPLQLEPVYFDYSIRRLNVIGIYITFRSGFLRTVKSYT